MNITLAKPDREISGALVVGVFENGLARNHRALTLLARENRDFLLRTAANEAAWSAKTVRVYPLPSRPEATLVVIGLGERQRWSTKLSDLAVRRAVTALKDRRIKRAALWLDDFRAPREAPADAIRRIAVNLLLADFQFTRYKETPEDGWPSIDEISIATNATKTAQHALDEGVVIGEETNHCRVLVNTPGGDMTPGKLALAATVEEKRAPGLNVRVLDEKDIVKLGMGGVLGVSRGSAERPRFIIIEYRRGRKMQKPLVFVGKGVTFDTGGINLKPESGLAEMHMDMSGAAAVIHAMSAIARLKLHINVVGLIPAVENMPSGSSYHPGDVLKTITGKTIEVLNTDAEGRIILADALGYARRYEPRLVVDVATLTGAAMVALGQRAIALFTQDRTLERIGRDIGERSGDVVWPLPLWDEYAEDIEGTIGDVANSGKTRYGGAITGAMFLKQFVGGYPWMHLDIAPTMTTIEGQHLAKGASGTGVRFLVELAKRYAKR